MHQTRLLTLIYVSLLNCNILGRTCQLKNFGVKVKVLHLKAVRVLAVQSLHPVRFNWFFPGKRVQNKLIDNDDPFGLVPVTIANIITRITTKLHKTCFAQ